jgi:hypothetical protein
MEVVLSKFAENPWCVVFEFEVVFGGWGQFVPDAGVKLVSWYQCF